MRVAILDDYRGGARDLADWSQLPPGSDLTVFDKPLGDEVAAALEPFDVLVIMRERTPFPAPP